MSINITLPSGLTVNDALGMLRERFRQWPWEKYDGDPPADPHVLDAIHDVDRVYQLGMRAPKQAYINLVQSRGAELTACLQRIPIDRTLEDADLASLKAPIVELFDVACSSKHVKMAGATKLLCPFRPSILPIIDSVVDRYYWYATSLRDEATFRRLSTIEGWGEYIFELLCLMQADVKGLRVQIDEIRTACSSEEFAMISRVRVLESLIWQYYARNGATFTDVPK